MLTIIYRGNFQPAVPEPVRWSTEWQVAATLEAMGHRVIRAQEDDPGWDWDRIVAAAMIERADLFLWTQTWNIDPDGGYRALDQLRELGVPSASFHLDLYFGLARAVHLLEQPFWRTDHVFTADGGHDRDFARNGIRHHWLPPAIYEPDAVRGIPQPGMTRWPVIFVGSYPYPHPEHAQARADIVRWLQSRFGSEFRHYRSGVRGAELANLYASAAVVVGDSCLAGRFARYWSDRIPETLGRAGFLIHPHVPGLDEHFVDGQHLRTYEAGDLGQLTALVQHYLANRDEARAIGAAGQAQVLAGHTYRHRMVSVIETVGLADRAEAAA